MRQSFSPPGAKPALPWLIGISVAVFVLQQLLNVMFPGASSPYLPGPAPNTWLTGWFALSSDALLSGKIWTVVSYGFLHGGVLHLLFNMIGLFVFGRFIEPFLGTRRFLALYFAGVVGGGLLYVVAHAGDSIPVVGASAAVFALLAFFCLMRPEQPITLLLYFVVPVTLKPKWVYWGFTAFSIGGLLLYEIRGMTGMAHSAHLGGIVAGTLLFRYFEQHRRPAPERRPRVQMEMPEWFVKRRPPRQSKPAFRVNRADRDELQKEVDRILDKINSSGFGSLSEVEKSTLDRAKDILSK